MQLEIPAGVDAVYFVNRNTDDLPLSIVGRATWETFSGNHRQSYWIQYTDIFRGSIKFINNQWYHIFWSNRINSYITEGDQFVGKAEIVDLGSLAKLLKAQRTTGGKKHNGHKDLSTQVSSKHLVSSKTQGGNNSPIQESINSPNEGPKSSQSH